MQKPELLAPAGEMTCLKAAIEAGADAVYLGMTSLNARERARNFAPAELVAATESARAKGVRVYVTLNTDLKGRETGEAASLLETAAAARANGILARDFATIRLLRAFPELECHLSTQAAVLNSLDVQGAKAIGAKRVVLGRELTLTEIAACAAVGGIQIEVFAHGAMCFSVSGKCLASSWVGGRSGNRGACTSPCRVPWTPSEESETPLSMRDLATFDRLNELAAAGVASLKVEGRLKNAAWVSRVIRLYRQALDGKPMESLKDDAEIVAAMSGRAQSSNTLDGKRAELTGVAGRVSLPVEQVAPVDDAPEETAVFTVSIDTRERGIRVKVEVEGQTGEFVHPKTVVRRPEKAMTAGGLVEWLTQMEVPDLPRLTASATDPEFLVVPRASNGIRDEVRAFALRCLKMRKQIARVEVRPAAKTLLEVGVPSDAGGRALSEAPDRTRITPGEARKLLQLHRPKCLVLEGVRDLDEVADLIRRHTVIVALPGVFFEDRIAETRRLVQQCRDARVSVEVNSLGGWLLARELDIRPEGGPGLAVLNPLAARELKDMGLCSVSVSVEAGHEEMEQIALQSPLPCSVTVFGRPALFTSRAAMPAAFQGLTLTDRRDTRVVSREENGLWVMRPEMPFDLRGRVDSEVRVRHRVMDLLGSPDPAGEYASEPLPRPGGFNYDRGLR